jgi:MFS family permease
MAHGLVHLRDLGHSPAQAAFSLSILSFSMLVGMLSIAAFGNRIDPKWLWATGMLVLALGVVWAFHATGTIGLYGYAVVVGFGFGGATPAAMATMLNYYGNRPYADIMGLLAVLSTTAGALAAYSAGFMYDHFGSYVGAFYGVALLCFAGAVIVAFTKPPVRKPAPQMAAAGVGQS